MSPQDLKSLANLLGSGELQSLVREAEARRDLTAHIRDLLPAAEAAHLVSVHADGGRWILAMDSPAWAARVRYRTTELGSVPIRVTVVPKGSG